MLRIMKMLVACLFLVGVLGLSAQEAPVPAAALSELAQLKKTYFGKLHSLSGPIEYRRIQVRQSYRMELMRLNAAKANNDVRYELDRFHKYLNWGLPEKYEERLDERLKPLYQKYKAEDLKLTAQLKVMKQRLAPVMQKELLALQTKASKAAEEARNEAEACSATAKKEEKAECLSKDVPPPPLPPLDENGQPLQ